MGPGTLLAFLQARLNEAWRLAKSARPADHGTLLTLMTVGDAGFYACNSPARVLAEVDAKRRLIELHAAVHRSISWLDNGSEESDEIPVCGHCVPKHSAYSSRKDVPEGPCPTLRLLALPYADHEDYDKTWRP